MLRNDGRKPSEIRPITITPHFLHNALGSVLVECGKTRVICAASLEKNVPKFLMNSRLGWLTAEYSLLPQSTDSRVKREVVSGRPSGRTQEIQRLIGRSLRGVFDQNRLPEFTLQIDCDVIDADGGTRTASITGAYVAARIAAHKALRQGLIPATPFFDGVAAISVGLLDQTPCVDLNYAEDSRAAVDMNVVLTHSGTFLEVQGTAEHNPFSREQLDQLLDLAADACKRIKAIQEEALARAL